MEIGSVGSFPPLPSSGSVNLSKVNKGPDLTYIPHSEPTFGGPDNDRVLSLLLHLNQPQDANITPSRLLEQVSQLQSLKQQGTESALLEATQGFLNLLGVKQESAANLGMMGVLSLLTNDANGDVRVKIAELIIKQASEFLDKPEFKLFAQPLFEGLLPFVPQIQPDIIHPFPVQIFKSGLLTEQPELKVLVDQFVPNEPAIVSSIDSLSPQLVQPLTIDGAKPPVSEPAPDLMRNNNNPYRLNLGVLQEAVRHLRASMVDLGWPLATRSPFMLTQVLMLDAIERRIGRQRRRTRFLHIAVVTHPSASISKELMGRYPVYQIPHDPENYIRIFHDLFVSLTQSGFQSIIVVLPNGEYWHSVHHARHAMAGVMGTIRVLDSHLFGLGLGLLVREVAGLLPKINRIDDMESRIARLASKIHYWIVPFNVGAINAHFWYQKMKRQKRLPGHFYPIIGFSDEGGIVSVADSPTSAVINLEKVVTDFFHQFGQPPRVVVVEHYDALGVAKGLGGYFQRVYPKVRVVLQVASPYMSAELGPFVGVVAF